MSPGVVRILVMYKKNLLMIDLPLRVSNYVKHNVKLFNTNFCLARVPKPAEASRPDPGVLHQEPGVETNTQQESA